MKSKKSKMKTQANGLFDTIKNVGSSILSTTGNIAKDVYGYTNQAITGNKYYKGAIGLPSLSLKHGYEANLLMGPGNPIQQFRDIEKKKDFINNISNVQKSSWAHDNRYFLAGLKDKKEDRIQAVRDADNKMIKKGVSDFFSLNTLKDPLEGVSSLIGSAGIKLKIIGEDLGLVDTYGSEKQDLSKDDEKLIRKQLNTLESIGYGINVQKHPKIQHHLMRLHQRAHGKLKNRIGKHI